MDKERCADKTYMATHWAHVQEMDIMPGGHRQSCGGSRMRKRLALPWSASPDRIERYRSVALR